MEPDIGIGMTNQACAVRDFDPANHNPVTGAEGVNVKAWPDPYVAVAARRSNRSAAARSDAVVTFRLSLISGDQEGRQPRGFGNRRIIGQFVPGRGLVGSQNRLEIKALRCLRAPQRRPVDGCAD